MENLDVLVERTRSFLKTIKRTGTVDKTDNEKIGTQEW